MKEKPIIFSPEMVRAILEGRKTQTRRVMTPQPEWNFVRSRWVFRRKGGMCTWGGPPAKKDALRPKGCALHSLIEDHCPYGQPGGKLWVRETWSQGWTYGGGYPCVFYKADNTGWIGDQEHPVIKVMAGKYGLVSGEPAASAPKGTRWKSPRFMPRWASRILLEITDIRIERVQEITPEDCEAEGILGETQPKAAFRARWDSINAKRGFGWDVNPWVWVITFKVLDVKNE